MTKLNIDELKSLDRLLDQALELAPSDRERWLDAIPDEHANLAATLRDLLEPDAEVATTQLFGRPPPFSHLVGAVASDNVLETGHPIGPYRLLRELGSGGMGTVWLAERIDGLIKRPVALKLPLVWVHNRALAERFSRERAILATLSHPNIARLYDAGISETGQPYLAIEYVEGQPLAAWCDERRASVAQRIRLFVQVLRAVQYAHANLVIHRDLKPSNILVTADGEVRLLDFGIAKLITDGEANETELTRNAGRALTPSYAAPEVLEGTTVNITSDIYSLGVIFYELVSGARPYRPRDDSRASLEAAILNDDPVSPSAVVTEASAIRRGLANARKLASLLSGDLDTIALKALKKRPDERYATAAAYAEDLERHLRGDAIEARADHSLYRAARLVSRHRVAFGAATLVALALISGTTIALWQAQEARREAARASAVQEFVLDLFRANAADQPDPIRARQGSVRELLDRGVSRNRDVLTEHPESRLELIETLWRLYAELGLWAEAADLSAQRLTLIRSRLGNDDVRLAGALVDHAGSLDNRGDARADEIDALFHEAERILDHRSDQKSKLRARLERILDRGDQSSLIRARMHQQASAHYANRSLETASDHAVRALVIYRAWHADDHGVADALVALANVKLRQGERMAALETVSEALQMARAQRQADYRLSYFLRRAGEINGFLDRIEDGQALMG